MVRYLTTRFCKNKNGSSYHSARNDKEFIRNLHGITRNDEEFIVNLFAMTDFFACVAVFSVLLATIPRRTRTPDTVAYFKP